MATRVTGSGVRGPVGTTGGQQAYPSSKVRTVRRVKNTTGLRLTKNGNGHYAGLRGEEALKPKDYNEKPSKMLYFAYGSNLELATIRNRCFSARPLCKATLADHALVFRNTHCDILPEEGGVVTGALYETTIDDEIFLDAVEGVDHYYKKIAVDVVRENGKSVQVYTYQMQPWFYYETPSIGYLTCVMRGYKDWGIDNHDLVTAYERSLLLVNQLPDIYKEYEQEMWSTYGGYGYTGQYAGVGVGVHGGDNWRSSGYVRDYGPTTSSKQPPKSSTTDPARALPPPTEEAQVVADEWDRKRDLAEAKVSALGELDAEVADATAEDDTPPWTDTDETGMTAQDYLDAQQRQVDKLRDVLVDYPEVHNNDDLMYAIIEYIEDELQHERSVEAEALETFGSPCIVCQGVGYVEHTHA